MLYLEEERMNIFWSQRKVIETFDKLLFSGSDTKHLAELACVWKDWVVCFVFELSFPWKFILVPTYWKIISTFSRLILILAAIISLCPDPLKEVLEAQACWWGQGCMWLVPSQLLFVVQWGTHRSSAVWGAFTQQSCLGKARLLSFLSLFTTAASALVEMVIKCMRN